MLTSCYTKLCIPHQSIQTVLYVRQVYCIHISAQTLSILASMAISCNYQHLALLYCLFASAQDLINTNLSQNNANKSTSAGWCWLSAEKGAGALLVTALDEVAWLLNLRGGDVSHNPVFVSYVLVQDTSATLYVDQKKVRTAAAA